MHAMVADAIAMPKRTDSRMETRGRRELVVVEASDAAPLVRRLVLAAPDGLSLPQWTPGAHIRVALPKGGDRAYSLVDLGAPDPARWVLCVRLDEAGGGGSMHMHGLRPGARIMVADPVNRFALHEGAAPALLIAGGIGVTPLTAMAAHMRREGRPFRFVYTGRSQGALALTEGLSALCADSLSLHYDDEPSRLDLAALLSSTEPAAHVYVCGPAGMIEATRKAAAAAGFPEAQIHFELFTSTPEPSEAEQGSFEVEARQSGKTAQVAAGQSIIDALEAAGVDLLYDCRRGDCGVCRCDVLEGEPDHRDVVLTPEERASNKVMQICVSRSKTPRLVLDI
jgi:ferredoxin-NADP reductase